MIVFHSSEERTLPKLCFDTRHWKRSFREVPSQAEPGTEYIEMLSFGA